MGIRKQWIFRAVIVNLSVPESIPVSLVPSSKPLGVFGPKLDAPQSDRFVADRDSAFGHEIFNVTSTQIEAVIELDRVLNDLRRETVTFVH